MAGDTAVRSMITCGRRLLLAEANLQNGILSFGRIDRMNDIVKKWGGGGVRRLEGVVGIEVGEGGHAVKNRFGISSVNIIA